MNDYDTPLIYDGEGSLIPTDVESEMTVLGVIMTDPVLPHYARKYIKPSDFYMEKNKTICQTIYDMLDAQIPVDLMTVMTRLKESGVLDVQEGIEGAYVAELYDSVPISEDGSLVEYTEYYARLVLDMSNRRQAMRTLNKGYFDLEKCDPDTSMDAILGDVIHGLSSVESIDQATTIKAELKSIFDMWNAGVEDGISTGIAALDKLVCGYQDGELYILAGRPGMGKTALAIKLIINLCRDGKKVYFTSLEMPIRQLLLRMLSLVSQVPYRAFRVAGGLGGSVMVKAVTAAAEIRAWEDSGLLEIDDTSGITVEQIVGRIEARYHKDPMDIAFIDHIHLIPAGGYPNPVIAYSHISLMLKNLPRHLSIPVVCLAQLSRGVENRPDKRPVLSDLRESGALEQNADNVWFMYREGYYERDDETKSGLVQPSELIISKNKSLATGMVPLTFNAAFMDFVDGVKEFDMPAEEWVNR